MNFHLRTFSDGSVWVFDGDIPQHKAKFVEGSAPVAAAVETKPVAWPIETDDQVEALAKECGWNNRRYMTEPDYTLWCFQMRKFAALASPPLLDAPEPVAGTWSWEYQLGPHITWTCGDSPPAKGQWVRNVEFKPYAFPERSKAVEPEPVADDGLRGVLDTLGKKQSELAHVLGSRSRASEYLSGKRELTKSAIVKIATAWGVSADVLLGLASPKPLLDVPRVTDEMVELASMALLGYESDPSPNVDWHANRAWKVSGVRQQMRKALQSAFRSAFSTGVRS